jgi:hypothetical protein
VAVRVTLDGTHLPTGQRTKWSAMVFARFADGKTERFLRCSVSGFRTKPSIIKGVRNTSR